MSELSGWQNHLLPIMEEDKDSRYFFILNARRVTKRKYKRRTLMAETWLRKLFETKKERKLLIWPPCRCGSVVVPLWSQGDKTFCQIPEFGLLAVVVPLWSQ